MGFRTHVIRDGCRGVELKPGDIERTFDEMRTLGIELLTSGQVERRSLVA